MKKIISFALLALVVAALPAMLVGCGGNKNASLEGTWVFNYVKFDHTEDYEGNETYTNDTGYDVWRRSDLVNTKEKITFSKDGTGKYTGNLNGYDVEDYDITWEIGEKDYVVAYFIDPKNKAETEEIIFIFKNGKLTQPVIDKIETEDIYVVCLIVGYKKA